jgi:hypothetical protein
VLSGRTKGDELAALKVNLLGHLQRIIDLDAKVSKALSV